MSRWALQRSWMGTNSGDLLWQGAAANEQKVQHYLVKNCIACRDLCFNCGTEFAEHPAKKCLFSPTNYLSALQGIAEDPRSKQLHAAGIRVKPHVRHSGRGLFGLAVVVPIPRVEVHFRVYVVYSNQLDGMYELAWKRVKKLGETI